MWGERGGGKREILPQIITPGQIITFGGGRVRLERAIKKENRAGVRPRSPR
jgi:hypothetical protein